MKLGKSAVAAGYSAAIVLAVFPVLESSVALTPTHPGNLEWRFAAVTLFTRSVLFPLIALLLSALIAATCEHKRMLRLLSLLTAVLSIVAICALGLFALDVLEMNSRVRTEQLMTFRLGALVTALKLTGVFVTLTIFTRAAWGVGRVRRRRHSEETVATPILRGGIEREAVTQAS